MATGGVAEGPAPAGESASAAPRAPWGGAERPWSGIGQAATQSALSARRSPGRNGLPRSMLNVVLVKT